MPPGICRNSGALNQSMPYLWYFVMAAQRNKHGRKSHHNLPLALPRTARPAGSQLPCHEATQADQWEVRMARIRSLLSTSSTNLAPCE